MAGPDYTPAPLDGLSDEEMADLLDRYGLPAPAPAPTPPTPTDRGFSARATPGMPAPTLPAITWDPAPTVDPRAFVAADSAAADANAALAESGHGASGPDPWVTSPTPPASAPRTSTPRTRAPRPPASAEDDFVAAAMGEPAPDALFSDLASGPNPQAHSTFLDRDLERAASAGDLGARRADAERAGYEAAAAASSGAERARLENEEMRRNAMANARARYENASRRASELSIDPEGWYHDRGAVGTITAAIATALGSLGAGLTGGTNEALGIINSSIERDLEAQRAAIDQAWRGADSASNLLSMMDAEFQSRGASLEAARAAMLEDVANRVAANMATLDSEEARLSAAQMHDDLLRAANAASIEAVTAEQDRELDLALRIAQLREANADATRAERRAAGGGAAYTTPTDALLSTANRLIDSGNDPIAVAEEMGLNPSLLRDGRFAEASTADSAGNVAALSAALDSLEALLPSDPDADIPGIGMTGPLPDAALSDSGRAVREEIANIGDLLGRLRSGAAISEDEERRFNRIIGGASTDAALRRGIARIRAEIDARTSRDRDGDTLDADVAAFIAATGGR